MADNRDITLKLRVLDAQGQFRGGIVDVEFKHRTLSDHGTQRGLDASREINIAGLRRTPAGDYQIIVTPTDVFKPQSQFVNIPASGFATMTVTIDRARTPDPKPDPIFVVNGTVRTAADIPFAKALVRALHQNGSDPVLLGEGRTDNQGNYVIEYLSAPVKGAINLLVQAFDEQGGVLATSAVIHKAKLVEQVNLVSDEEDPKTKFAVQGHVRGLKRNLLSGLSVRAFDCDLPSLNRDELLGETITGKDGFYRIEYTAANSSRAEKDGADVQVRVYSPNMPLDEKTLLTESETRFNAKPEETLDLVVTANQHQGLSEYERLLAAVTPLVEDLPIAALTAEDFDFLAGETAEDGKHLAMLTQAHHLAKGTGIPASIFYGWFRVGLPTEWEALRLQRISALRTALLDAMDQSIIPASLRGDLERVLALVRSPQIDEFSNLLASAALSPDKIQSVLAHADGIEAVSDQVLAKLVEQKTLAAHEAQFVGLSVSLHRLAAGDQSLVSTMLDSDFVSLSAGKLKQARDLASLESEDWERALEKSGSPAAGGIPRGEYARSLAMDAVSEFPHAAFVHRATRVPERMPDKLNTIQPLLRKNANAIALDFDDLDLTGMNGTDQKGLLEAHAELQRFANLHPGLDLHTVLSKQDGVGNVVAVVNERVGWLSTVFAQNPKIDFLNLDYLPDSADLREVKFGDLSEEARGLVLQDLKAHQRIFTVTNNAIPSREIMQAGFHSASAIALARVSDFAGKTGLAGTEAQSYHAEARDIGNEAAVNLFRFYEAASDHATAPIRSIPSRNEFFTQLTGFQELINSQAWCECAHCQSVLSPAAYFVDLMYYIEQNILRDSFSGKERHPLHLKVRRPDLWDLELTCKNTDDYVPYLDVVNDILESYLKDTLALDSSPAVYQHLSTQVGSFKQPFTLPMERLEILLEHFGLSRYDVAKAMGSDKEIQERARLKISRPEYDLITRERSDTADLDFFKQLFKIKDVISIASSETLFNPLEMQTFLYSTGLAHETVASVLNTKFVNFDEATIARIEVVLGKQRPDDVQNNSELVHNLTLRRLDRIHRFLRLWRKLPWTIEELDYVLARLATQQLSNGIDGNSLSKILDLLDAKWSLPIDELMALSDVFPEKGLREPTSLFDRLFNQQPFLDRDGRWPPNPAIRFTHPAWANSPHEGVSSPDNNTLSRLLAGLQIGDKDLVELITSLLAIPAVGRPPATPAPPSDKSIELSKDSISILYRHARLMRLLKCTMTDFIKLISLTPRIAQRVAVERYVRDLEDVKSVIEFTALRETSGFSLDEIIYFTSGTRPEGSPDPVSLASEIVARVQLDKSLDFADTVFTQIGLTDIQSRTIVMDNVSKNEFDNKAFELLPDTSYRLKAGFDSLRSVFAIDPLIDPPVDETTARNLLGKYETMHVLDVALGSILNLSPEETGDLRHLTRPLASAEIIEINLALALPGADKIRLTALLTDTLRFRALFKNEVFLVKNKASNVNGLTFVRSNSALFGLPIDPADQSITTQVVRNVAAYVALATVADAGFTTASRPADLEAIQNVITGVSAASGENLAKTLGTDDARIAALKPHLIGLPTNPFDALDVLARCLALAEQLGVTGETLSLMTTETDDTFATLSRAAEDIYGAFRAKYPNEKTFTEKLEPFEDKLRMRKRDGLVDFIVSKWPEPFVDASKLYEYFLIDVMQGGCARTSRVVAAISSLQLYVNRVLMHLEWSKDWHDEETGVNARFTDSDKQAEWYWREHYRVWEANRRVFLYPENYIEPELRDDKTPLFMELENTLLQQEISDATANDAYAKYLVGFDEVAHLKIAGAYYDPGTHPDRRNDALHLFGVTQGSPTVYYYRVINKTLTTAPTSAWQRLTLQIPVHNVSPIVFEGRLYLFWTETTTRSRTSFDEGTSKFEGYRHSVRVKYSLLRPDGNWTSPQALGFAKGLTREDYRIVDDPLTDNAERLAELQRQIEILEPELERLLRRAADAERPALLAGINAQTLASALRAAMDTVQPNAAEWILIVGAAAAIAPVVGPELALAQAVIAWRALKLKPLVDAANAAAEERRRTAEELATASRAAIAVRGQLEELISAADPRNLRVSVRWDRSGRDHREPLDTYKPEGWEWDRVYPNIYTPANASGESSIRVMLVPRNAPVPTIGAFQLLSSDEVDFTAGLLRQPAIDQTSADALVRINNFHGQLQLLERSSPTYGGQRFYIASFWLNSLSAAGTFVGLAPANSDLQIVNGDPTSLIVESNGYPVWMRKEGAFPLIGTRLSTTLTPTLTNRFGHQGVNGILNAEFQRTLAELPPQISPVDGEGDPTTRNPFHPINPFLTCFHETFFHIPFLVANHLNSRQKFAETQRWYHYIFNPTASDGNPWRYREFDDPMIAQSLREMLTDPLALAAYRADPFNPHAIARTRLSAYQKSIVMKYIDNLLDWGDSLFTQFTLESLNEATMLYVMAQEILGPRPAVLGSCGEGKVSPKDYKTIRLGLNTVSDFLIELEVPRPLSSRDRPTLKGEATKLVSAPKSESKQKTATTSKSFFATGSQPLVSGLNSVGPVEVGSSNAQTEVIENEFNQVGGQYWTSVGGTALKSVHATHSIDGNRGVTILGTETGSSTLPGSKIGNIDVINPTHDFAAGEIGVAGGTKIKPFDRIPPLDVKYGKRDIPLPGLAVNEKTDPTLRHPQPIDLVPPQPKNAVFCIPPNKDLLAYWGRVEDRLFKIRNCMDIAGVRRRPELFAPEIDPRFLVRMKAAGLTLDDVLNSISGNVPPYRFSYLIEKAKQYVGTLQSFGTQLLSALEKHDGEELANLRAVHEHNLLTMRTRMTQLEIDAAEDTIEGLRRQKTAAEYREQYFHSLSDVGPIASERTQQQHQRQASEFRTLASVSQFIAAILSIIPDVGAPTAMKFGGSQLGAAGRAAADGLNAIAGFNEMAASMAGIESSNQRRDQEWKHQIETAKRDISQIEKQITAAEIKRDIAAHSLEVHQQTIDQSEQIFEFFRNEKFTNINLYRLLSNRLQGLYRQAFNSALTMARMTEQAYRSERTDDVPLLDGNYWDAGNAGLLAGERLLIDLQALEQRYIERNYRQLELEQSFSLAQFVPDELVKLRLTGNCEFLIPEWFFDLTYPGQYRRRLKAARLTVPCVTGPYTNVGATLRLKSSEIRLTPLAEPTPVPLRHTVGMASSKGQYDAGVFDFSFRDERYMPFEGAGAISKWQLSLPETLRVFDYTTISDVILHLSYTADFDGVLKDTRENEARGVVAALKQKSITRLFSLRHEFPDVFHRLATSPPNTEIDFTIEARHFPFFLAGRSLNARRANLRVLSPLGSLGSTTTGGTTTSGTTFEIERKGMSSHLQVRVLEAAPLDDPNSQGIGEFDFGNVLEDSQQRGIATKLVGDYLIKLTDAGPLASGSPGRSIGAVDPAKLQDILLEVGYSLAEETEALNPLQLAPLETTE